MFESMVEIYDFIFGSDKGDFGVVLDMDDKLCLRMKLVSFEIEVSEEFLQFNLEKFVIGERKNGFIVVVEFVVSFQKIMFVFSCICEVR